MKNLKIALISGILICNLNTFSQNVFQSNLYMLFQPNINFASASSYEGINAAGFYRNQWVNFKGAPSVLGVNAFFTNQEQNSSIGLSLYQDNVGIHQNTEISLNYAYNIKLNDNLRLSLSISPTLLQLKDDYSSLNPTQENDALLATSSTISRAGPNVKFGSYLYGNNFYLGFASPNLLTNNIKDFTTINTSFELKEINYYLHGGYRKKLNNANSIGASAFLKSTSGSFLHAELNLLYNFLSEKIGLGAGFKTSKELTAILRLKPTNNFTIGYAYQYTLTDINKYISGGHEILLIYNAFKPERVKITPPRF